MCVCVAVTTTRKKRNVRRQLPAQRSRRARRPPEGASRELRQRQPGDFDAQVTQRPIAIHGLEHLATTDRGVTLFRQEIRRGIRAVQGGNEPEGLLIQEGDPIATYANNTVVRVAPADTQEEDDKLLRETGRNLAEQIVNNPPLISH